MGGRPGKLTKPLLAFAGATALAAAASLLGGVVPFVGHNLHAFIAIIFTAWYGGFGPVITASLLGLASAIILPNAQAASGHPFLGRPH